MLFSWKELKKIPVVTSSGQELGRISEISVDGDSFKITQIKVKNFSLPLRTHLIAWEQIISVDEKKILVRDASVTEQNVARVVQSSLSSSPALNADLSS